MVTAYARRSFNGGAIATTIPNGMGASDTSFTLALATNWSFANNFYVDVDRGLPTEEKILCSGISGLVVSVASGGRGADGSSAVAHSAGCTVQVVHVAQDDDEANQLVAQTFGLSGLAKGDLYTVAGTAANAYTLQRIPVGSAGQILGATSGGIAAYGAGPASATGDLLYASSATLLARLAGATAGWLLNAGGATGPPSWAAPSGGVVGTAHEVSVTTGSTTVTSYVPTAPGNYIVGLYFRVTTGTTAVTATATWTDTTGAQTATILNGVSESTGSYAVNTFAISATTSGTITVSMTAATASQVFGSASILQG